MKRLSFFILGCSLILVLCNAAGCKNKSESATAPTNQNPPAAAQATEITTETSAQEEVTNKTSVVKIKTKFGDMTVMLYDETPKHRDNFLKLVGEKYYDGLLFHRCIRNFMIQGGDPQSRGAAMTQMLGGGGPGFTVPAEFNPNLIHKKGALCAARQGDQVNPKKESSGSQFYIVQGSIITDMQLSQNEIYIASTIPGFKYTEDQKKTYKTIGGTPNLDMNYTVFGEVIEGLNVVDSIAAQPTIRGDRPLQDVIMNMEIVKKSRK